MSLPRYAEYVSVDEAWVAQVPLGWSSVALSRVLKEPVTDGPHTTPVFEESGVPFLSVDAIQNGELWLDGCRYISELDHLEFARKAAPRRDDILMGKAASVGKIARVKVDAVFSIWSPLALIRIDPALCLPAFAEYVLKSAFLQAQIETTANSNTQLNIGMKDIPKLRICLPPMADQIAIVSFLERETAKIDALIAEQEKLLALLAEKRQATISHAVTRGLDPNAPMKDSGIPWLGEVPAHWRVGSLRNVCESINTGPFGTALGNEDYVEGGVPVINPSHIVDSRITPDPRVSVSTETAERLEYWALRRQDIVAARRGELGRAAVVGPESEGWICGTGSLRLRVSPSLATPEFVHAVLQSRPAREWLNLQSVGSTMANLNEQILGQLPVAMPPSTAEQEAVMAALSNSIAAHDGVVSDVGEARRLLLERRSALIAAAVTGQIDVRGAVESQAA